MNHQLIQLLNEAKREITNLRRHNEILTAQVEVVRVFAHCSGAVSRDGGQAMCVDVAWELGKEIERQEGMNKAVQTAAAQSEDPTA